MDIKIKINKKALDHALGRLDKRGIKAVVRKGLNAAASAAKRMSSEEIRKIYALKKKDADVQIRKKNASELKQESSITILAKPIGLEKFNPLQTPTGLSVKVYANQGVESIPHAFLQKMKNGTKKLAMIRTKVIDEASRKYVRFPSKKESHRSNKGSELPINRLLADPIADAIAPKAAEIAEKASAEGSVAMMVATENLLDLGKGK